MNRDLFHLPACALTVWLMIALVAPPLAAEPQPGEVYREYRLTMRGQHDWRVTQPYAVNERANVFLPNPRLTLQVDDLRDAVRAEALIDRWGGHPGTPDKQVRFNDGAWITLPELTTTPAGQPPELFYSHDNLTISVPLADLKEGENTVEGTCGRQFGAGLNWGQWGWTSLILRVYYDPPRRAHATAAIESPRPGETLGENPRIIVAVSGDVDQVDVLAFHEGYDENGDGVFRDWHQLYTHDRRHPASPEEPRIAHHAGSATEAPYEVVWNTRWVPDQEEGAVMLMARVRSRDGLWYASEIVKGLSLRRDGEAVRLYRPLAVPEDCGVRADRWCAMTIRLPGNPAQAREASLHLRTWNGANESFWINSHEQAIEGGNHTFAYTVHPVEPAELRRGDNVIEFHSTTEHHAIEVCWPGPALMVRFAGPR